MFGIPLDRGFVVTEGIGTVDNADPQETKKAVATVATNGGGMCAASHVGLFKVIAPSASPRATLGRPAS